MKAKSPDSQPDLSDNEPNHRIVRQTTFRYLNYISMQFSCKKHSIFCKPNFVSNEVASIADLERDERVAACRQEKILGSFRPSEIITRKL